jgi:hypothetical protein
MSPSFERRLTILSAVVIGGGIFAIVIALALFAFSVYIGSLNRDVHDAIVDVRSVLQGSGGPQNDARLAARRLAAQLFSPQIRISLLYQRRRVDLYRRSPRARRWRWPPSSVLTRNARCSGRCSSWCACKKPS